MSDLKTYLGWTIDFSRPAGEPAFAAPDSVSWQVFKNPVALAIGGVCAVLMEFAEPRIRTGVWAHSTFKTDPLGRARRTGMAAMVGVYGPASAARRVIAGVNNMHARVQGETPAGEPYDARDSELLEWVAATASYGFASAYDRFVTPLDAGELDRFHAEGETVARLYGVRNPVCSNAQFNSLLERLAPRFEPHPINREFLAIMSSGRAAPGVPERLPGLLVNAAVDILPPVVRERLELGRQYRLTGAGRASVRALGRIAESLPDPGSPAAQASARLGLPRHFPWRSASMRARLIAKAHLQGRAAAR
jgi:uncharacterized protein (DUF2236 family)